MPAALKAKLLSGKTKVLKQERKLKRNKSGKVVVIGFYTVIAGVLFLSVESYARTGFLNGKINSFRDEARAEVQNLNTAGFVVSPAGQDYAERFINTYINIPKDQKGRDERAAALNNYFAEGLTLDAVENLSEFHGKRVLKDVHLYKTSDIKAKSAVLQFRINYDVITVADQKVKGRGKKGKEEVKTIQKEQPAATKEMLISVPLGTDGHSFNVIEQPHFSALPTGERLAAVTDQADKTKQNFSKEGELKQFATQFFTSYTENTVQEMSYLMAEPDSLKGLYQYKGLDSFTAYNGKKGDYILKCLVVMKDTNSGLTTKEPITLTVTKQNGKYFVEKINYTIGG